MDLTLRGMGDRLGKSGHHKPPAELPAFVRKYLVFPEEVGNSSFSCWCTFIYIISSCFCSLIFELTFFHLGRSRQPWVEKLSLYSSSVHFPDGASGKEPHHQCKKCKRYGFDPWVEKIPWRRAWQPTPVLLPREFYGQRRLAGYSPQDHTESDRLEQLSMHVVALYISF